MPKIIVKRQVYSGTGSGSSGGTGAIEITQAEYNALSEEEKNKDVLYLITDAPSNILDVVHLTLNEYNQLSAAEQNDGRFYHITDDDEIPAYKVTQQNINSTETVPSSAVVYELNQKIDKALFNIVEIKIVAPLSIAANNHIHTVFTLSKTYDLTKTTFILSPVSYKNTAFISACGHWGSDAQDATSLTASNQITVYVTNHYEGAAQSAGAYVYILEKPLDD